MITMISDDIPFFISIIDPVLPFGYPLITGKML